MNKTQYYFLTLLILLIFAVPVIATPVQWSKLYSKNDWVSLQQLYDSGKLDNAWRQLWDALNSEDADKAESLYREVIRTDGNGQAGRIAKVRLKQLGMFKLIPLSELKLDDTVATVVSTETTPKSATMINATLQKSPDLAKPPVIAGSSSLPTRTEGEKKNPSQPIPVEKSTSNPAGKFAAQFGVFSVKSTADRIAAQLRENGYQVEVVEWMKEGKKLYRVWSGRFLTQKEAAAQVAAVKRKIAVEGITTRIE